MGYIYLASPYSHPDAAVREARYRAVRDATAWMIRRGMWVYSPIVHTYDISQTFGLPTDAGFWRDYNHAMIAKAEMLYILTLPGYSRSVGIMGEIKFARSLGLPILHLEPPPAEAPLAQKESAK